MTKKSISPSAAQSARKTAKGRSGELVAVQKAAQKPTHASRAEIRRAIRAVVSLRQANA